jgi:hypothetical protein
MQQKVRTIILEPDNGERGLEPPVELARMRVLDLLHTLVAVGGEFTVRADRVKIGEMPGTDIPCGRCAATGRVDYDQGNGEEDCRACGGTGFKPGRPEPIGETIGFIMQWRDLPELREESLTQRLMDHVLGDNLPEPGAVAEALTRPVPDEEPETDPDDAGEAPEEE